MRFNPELFKKYGKYFKEQLEAGIIEELQENDHGLDGWTHYLPHHPVIRQDKETTKLRVVFDDSCSFAKNPSLNQCLNSGPSVIPELYDVMLRFR